MPAKCKTMSMCLCLEGAGKGGGGQGLIGEEDRPVGLGHLLRLALTTCWLM